MLENNQTAERLELGENTWIWDRAYVNSLNQSWQGLFPWNGAEWTASGLKSPATFLVMGGIKPANGPGDRIAVSPVWPLVLFVQQNVTQQQQWMPAAD